MTDSLKPRYELSLAVVHAAELKNSRIPNTMRGFAASAIIVLSLFFLINFGPGNEPKLPSNRGSVSSIPLLPDDYLKKLEEKSKPVPEESQEPVNDVPKEEMKKVVEAGSGKIAANFNAVDDSIATTDITEVALIDEVWNSFSDGRGDGTTNIKENPPVLADNSSKPKSNGSAIPPQHIFNPVEEEPVPDMKQLYKVLKYPEMARQARIEGRVIVSVYIAEDGSPAAVKILDSENSMLDEAATDAVKSINYKPARQNDKNVGCWISIPIQFRLR
jgi:TonB family protein